VASSLRYEEPPSLPRKELTNWAERAVASAGEAIIYGSAVGSLLPIKLY